MQRLLDHGLGIGLLVGSLLLLLATDDMGFVRDEAFYFRHAETYQDWFVDVEEGGEARTDALRRERILKVWRNNFEHPPLDKVLFGYSWRVFGRKLRPVGAIREGLKLPDKPASLTARVSGLGDAHGFEEGARVSLLAPQRVGEPAGVEGRALASGVVTARTRWSATVAIDAKAAGQGGGLAETRKRLERTCLPPGPGAEGEAGRRTGCEAVEERGTYWLSESAAMRAPGALFAALLVWLVWLVARGVFGGAGGRPLMRRPFAALAALGFLLLPRPFFHSHLACFDITIVTLLFATTVAYHRSLRSRRWLLPTALLWGVALLAKHNALFFPVALMAHWGWDGLAEGGLRVQRRPGRVGFLVLGAALALGLAFVSKALALAALLAAAALVVQVHLPPLPKAWFWMLPVGFVLLIAGWPLLWVDTLHNLLRWIEFHLHHEHYMQQYFGAILAYPPFPVAMPFVLTALTWPLTLLVPALVGWGDAALRELRFVLARVGAVAAGEAAPDEAADEAEGEAREGRSLERLFLLSSVWPILLIALPSTPVFGGTKHWFLAYPFLLLLGAGALDRALAAWTPRRWSQSAAIAAAWALVVAIGAPAAQATWDVHPHGTMYYNALIGGVPGAAEAGLQRQFWGGATRDGLALVNERAPRGARVWFHNSAWGAYRMYQREGWFRRDLAYHHSPAGSAFGFYHHHKDHDDYELDCLQDYGVMAPVQQVHIEGVPVLSVYQRPKASKIQGDPR